MNTDTNKELVTHFVDEFWSQGKLDAADRLMSPDAVIHEPPVGNVSGLKHFNESLRRSFPDWRSTPEELVAEGDRVAERWTGRGTHRSEFQGIAPTGNQVEVPGVVFYRIEHGLIVEFRGSFDLLRMLTQLGAIPASSLSSGD